MEDIAAWFPYSEQKGRDDMFRGRIRVEHLNFYVYM
jgi:hypothetical protein